MSSGSHDHGVGLFLVELELSQQPLLRIDQFIGRQIREIIQGLDGILAEHDEHRI